LVVYTRDAGKQWIVQKLETSGALGGVACPTTKDCFGVGEVILPNNAGTDGLLLFTATGGAKWSQQELPNAVAQLSALSCASTADCWAVGANDQLGLGATAATTDGGAVWAQQRIPAASGLLDAISCHANPDCVSVGVNSSNNAADILATADGGLVWKSEPYPEPLNFLQSVSCATKSDCWAVGGGVMLASTNGGATWAQQKLPLEGLSVTTVSCPSATECVATADSTSWGVLETTDAGAKWAFTTLPNSGTVQDLDGLSCPAATSCVAVGSDSVGGIDYGEVNGHWALHVLPAMANGAAVSCAQTQCWAVGISSKSGPVIDVTAKGGDSWAERPVPEGVYQLFGVSCVTADDCWAVGEGFSGGAVVLTTLAPG
jgi:photosystem II stability/assembly factor-like uncharacterized protein